MPFKNVSATAFVSSANTIKHCGTKMYGWQYNEKILKDLLYNHSKDFGRFYCELMLDYPKLFEQFMQGYMEEFMKRNDRKDE
jgi:hypothetical protein